MFWKKKKYIDQDLGELEFSYRAWFLKTEFEGKEFFIDIEGSKESPCQNALIQAKSLFLKIGNVRDAAIKYIREEDISHFTVGNGELIFDGFTSSSNPGEFDLGFGLSEWDDALIVVKFKNGIPHEIQLGD